MKHKCPVCRTEYELGPNTLPECPECIRSRMKHPDGIKEKHTLAGATKSKTYASFISGEVKPKDIFDYMAYGPHTTTSGCEVFYSKQFNGFNAVSLKPLEQIPGSGIQHGHPFAADFAVLQDIEGKSNDGPHWAFEDQAHLQLRISTGEWVPASKCASCGQVWVYIAGDSCLNCKK